MTDPRALDGARVGYAVEGKAPSDPYTPALAPRPPLIPILIIKTGALGDVLRTTSILPGLHERYRDCRITWVTAPGAADLVRLHPLVSEVIPLDPNSLPQLEAVSRRLSLRRWDRVLSFDDEEPLCRLAADLPTKRLSGARLTANHGLGYTPDTGPWFDMGLLSVYGKHQADRLKLVNQRSHPQIFAEMLGISMGKPQLPLPPACLRFAQDFARSRGLDDYGTVVGLNTGAGDRWVSKALPTDRTVALAHELHEDLGGDVGFLILGGPKERERNDFILSEMGEEVRAVDAGCDNGLLDFAALLSRCDLLVTSDSLALHVAVARSVPVVAFFAPTSAAEIELYGKGIKVASTSCDRCSYRPDADTTTITVERLKAACLGLMTGK